ncbi:MAG: hypothetical protein BroJett011_54210 [Chloroflexota bacterium]|nr:MAG: hypothetical protein BroJett011_54210 [Chloroflexota bacterium]
MEPDVNTEERAAVPEAAISHPVERAKFRSLLLTNPNYFGNLKVSPFKPVKVIVGDTRYEELKCVGYNPDLNCLKAVVWVKLNSGYSGGICSGGSQEYVRFYVSFDNGATWQDQGMASFTAYDLPGTKPLEYAVTLQPKDYWTWCSVESLPKVRAVLSWNDAPPADQPDWPPVWGNVVEAHIQVRAQKVFFVGDLFTHLKVKLPKHIGNLIDLQQQVKAPPAQPLNAGELQALYKDKGVHEHRLLYSTVKQYLVNPGLIEAYKAYGSPGPLAELQVDLGKILAALEETDGDTGYEELKCVGLDPNGQENLVGIFTIKRPYGYAGPQCSTGSQEYVAFWIDWEDGMGWQWMGAAQINVHDFSTIPADGLQYTVAQPINLAPHRQPCTKGVVTARVRAILSWQTMPPAWNPDYKPTWGNRVETRIHLYPGDPIQTGDYKPYLDNVCGIALCSINQTTGFAASGERPFGGSVSIFGDIPGAPNVLTPPSDRPRYKITVRPFPAGVEQALNNPFGVTLDEQIGGGMPTSTPFTQVTDPSNYYTYQDAPPTPSVGWRRVSPSRLLGVWDTTGKTGLWEIKIEAKDPITNTNYVAGTKICVIDGTSRQNVVIKLDNEKPITAISITGHSHDGGATWSPATPCGTFRVGDIIKGTYSVSDEHFGSLSLTVQPNGDPGAHGTPVNPASRGYPVVPTTGEAGEWTLNTTDMDPCGYTVWLQAWDRTLVSCDGPWENESAFVGFCLVAKAGE